MKYIVVLYIFSLSIVGCSNAQEISTPIAGEIIRHESFKSAYVDARHLEVWLPEGYADDQAYPVLYMHDGQNLFDASVTWNKQEWMVDDIVTRLAREGLIGPVIVVGIFNNGKMRHPEYFPQKPFEALTEDAEKQLSSHANPKELETFKQKICSDDYLSFIVKELKPFIDQTYQTMSNQSNTYIGGSSMGGLISMYAICEYPDVFGGAACVSTHWPGFGDFDGNPIPDAFVAYLEDHLPSPENHKIWFDHGTATLDETYGPLQKRIDKVMEKHLYSSDSWTTKIYPGANHSELAWQQRFDEVLLFLLGE
jgi:predicted alpha/beta superfamily hydrolase